MPTTPAAACNAGIKNWKPCSSSQWPPSQHLKQNRRCAAHSLWGQAPKVNIAEVSQGERERKRKEEEEKKILKPFPKTTSNVSFEITAITKRLPQFKKQTNELFIRPNVFINPPVKLELKTYMFHLFSPPGADSRLTAG